MEQANNNGSTRRTSLLRAQPSQHVTYYGAVEQSRISASPLTTQEEEDHSWCSSTSIVRQQPVVMTIARKLLRKPDHYWVDGGTSASLQNNHPTIHHHDPPYKVIHTTTLEGTQNWKRFLWGCLVVGLAMGWYHYRQFPEETHNLVHYHREAEWQWDHNVYRPRQSSITAGTATFPNTTTGSSTTTTSIHTIDNSDKTVRNLLLAQLFSRNTILHTMATISSRPNRAYAKQWGRDYVRYAGPSTWSWSNRRGQIERTCLDKVYVLNTLLARQANQHYTSHVNEVQYDVIVLLPPNAIITDLDYDLLHLFPSGKLVGVATYEDTSDKNPGGGTYTDLVFFNLRHEYAMEAAELWYRLTLDVTCGAGNDMQLLLNAIDAILVQNDVPEEQREEELEALVTTLWVQNKKGFITTTDHVMKILPQQVPSSKAMALVVNAVESKAELQTTADSVCYRYYPRCEVL